MGGTGYLYFHDTEKKPSTKRGEDKKEIRLLLLEGGKNRPAKEEKGYDAFHHKIQNPQQEP